jgi:hypothetical protein
MDCGGAVAQVRNTSAGQGRFSQAGPAEGDGLGRAIRGSYFLVSISVLFPDR